MPQTLASMVRAKHPGAYDDLSDQALEQAITTKFPGVYDDIPRSADSPVNGKSGGVLSTAADVGIGALKGAAGTAVGLGELVHKVPGVSRAVDALYGQSGLSERSFPAARAAVAPTNTAQKIGRGVEQMAEVVLPMGMVSKATAGANLATRMATQGAGMAAISTAQDGDPLTAGIVGATIPAAGAVVSKLPAGLRESASKKVAQALGATKERFKAIAAKRAPEIIARGLGGSRKALLADATAHAREAGQAVDDVLTAAGAQRVPTSPVLDALEEAKGAFQQVRQVPLPEAVKTGLVRTPGATVNGQVVSVPVVLDARPIEQLTKLQQTIRELGDDASVEQLTAVRRVWDDVVSRAGGFAHRSGSQFGVPLAEQTEAWAKREATKSIRKVLADEVPDLAKVNAEYAFWKDLKDVLTATQQRTQAQGPGLSRMVGGVVGAATGFGSGGDPMSSIGAAVVGGYLAPAVVKAVTSPQMRFASAHARNALADAIESGNAQRMSRAALQILGAQTAQAVSR